MAEARPRAEAWLHGELVPVLDDAVGRARVQAQELELGQVVRNTQVAQRRAQAAESWQLGAVCGGLPKAGPVVEIVGIPPPMVKLPGEPAMDALAE